MGKKGIIIKNILQSKVIKKCTVSGFSNDPYIVLKYSWYIPDDTFLNKWGMFTKLSNIGSVCDGSF